MNTAPTWMRMLATALAHLLRLRQPPLPAQPQHPHQLQVAQLLLAQLQRASSLHQVLQVERLAACWLAGPQLEHLRQHLQAHLAQLQTRPRPSPTSTSSRGKTARRTGKRRR